jgi:hypothetical protein
MCILHYADYPCNHRVILFCQPCLNPTSHPPNPPMCTEVPRDPNDNDIPKTCPCKKSVYAKSGKFPLEPEKFANFCLAHGIGLEGAMAMCPSWVLGRQGGKIGTRDVPWRVWDYVLAFMRVREKRRRNVEVAIGEGGGGVGMGRKGELDGDGDGDTRAVRTVKVEETGLAELRRGRVDSVTDGGIVMKRDQIDPTL